MPQPFFSLHFSPYDLQFTPTPSPSNQQPHITKTFFITPLLKFLGPPPFQICPIKVYIILKPLLSKSISPHNPIKHRPRQDKTHQPSKNITYPKTLRPVEKFLRFPMCRTEIDEQRDEERADSVKYKTGVGLKTESAGSNAEEGGC